MSLSPERGGKFTASQNFRLMAENGEVDWSPRREGAKGVGYTCWTGGEYIEEEDRFDGGFQYVKTVFKTDKEYKDFVAGERRRLGEFVLPVGAKSYAEEKACEVVAADDPLAQRIETRDMKRGHIREQEAADHFAMLNDIDLFYTGDNQQFILWGDNAGGTPDARIGSIGGVTCDFKCPTPLIHQGYILKISDNETLLKESTIYYAQQQTHMAAADTEHAYFVSFNPFMRNPRARMHTVRINRDQKYINKMTIRRDMAAEYRDEIIQRVRSL